VHVVPHSHDDVGWLKTLDEYFDGSRKDIQFTNVKVELTSVVHALLADPTRRFSEVEMAFFKKWYDMQSDDMKEKTKGLIKSGQLEIINAGWSMHDEATPIYEDMIENMMYGQKWVLEEFGQQPRIGWQIDPFGHSNTNARLFYEMGFEAMFFGR
jgi:lysosomal alpha-mannosidase